MFIEKSFNWFIEKTQMIHLVLLLSDCVKDELQTFLNVTQREVFTRCSTPWLGNITHGIIKDYDLQEPCNISEATAQSVGVADFFLKSASYSFPQCQRK